MTNSQISTERAVFSILLFVFGAVFGFFIHEPISEFIIQRQQTAFEQQKTEFIGKNIHSILMDKDLEVINAGDTNSLDQQTSKIMFFWSPSCDHCKKAMEVLQVVSEKYKDSQYFGFLVSNDIPLLKSYIREHHIEFPQVVSSRDDKIKDTFKITSIPQLWTIRPDNSVSDIITDLSLGSVEAAISSCESCSL